MKILNFGSLNMDHVYEMTHFVQGKETLTFKCQIIFSSDSQE